MQEEYLTLREAADYLRVSPLTLRRAVWSNRIVVRRVGNAPNPKRRAMRFTRDSLDRYATQTDTTTLTQPA